MKSQVILVAVTALIAGVIGGIIGSSVGKVDQPVHASAAAPPPAPQKVAPVFVAPPMRSVEDELKLIEARGNWEIREALTEMKPVTLQIGSETLVSILSISWKPDKLFDADYEFYRLVGTKLERVNIEEEE